MDKLIEKLRKRNIDIDVVDNQLKLGIPEGQEIDNILEEIKQNKHQLIEFISKIKNTSSFIEIKACEPKKYYVLSSAQQRLYFLHQLFKDGLGYNITRTVKLLGNLNSKKIRSTFNALIARHEILRTVFELVDNRPLQRILPTTQFDIEYYKSDESGLASVIEKFVRPFEMDKAPLMRAGLIKISETEHVLIVDTHHIITDGISQGILINDFMSLYKGETLPALSLQYKDYAEWQQSDAQKTVMKNHENFWLKEFEEEVTALQLPSDFSQPHQKNGWGSHDFSMSEEETTAIRTIAKEQGTTQFVVFLTLYNILLAKLSNSEDVVVGTPSAGRQHADVANMMGMFVNTLSLRNFPSGKKSFHDFLLEVKNKVIRCFDHQSYQYENLIEALNIDREIDRNPLFDVMFTFQNYREFNQEILDLQIEPFDIGNRVSLFDITLTVFEGKEEMFLNFQYNAARYAKQTIEKFATYFLKITKTVLADLTIKIGNIELISKLEKQVILNQFNDTKVEYPAFSNLSKLFEEKVEDMPDKIAIVEGNKNYTYQDLNLRANQIGRLIAPKIKNQECVAILADRSYESIVAMLAIIKAGGAYLPLDPDYPSNRLIQILDDAKVAVALCQNHYKKLIPSSIIKYSLEDCGKEQERYNLGKEVKASNLAYIMYTSGSTGKPKGVMVTHKNVIRLVINTDYVLLDDNTRILQTGAPVFDATTFEIWGCLLNGGMLQLVIKEVLLNTKLLKGVLYKQKINTLWLTAALFDRHTQENPEIFKNLSQLLVGGDKLTPSYINRVKKEHPGLKIINGYGPTENTTFSVCHHIENNYQNNIPIGRPIANSTAYIVDNYGHLLPIGVKGELYVGGDGVASGYLNNRTLSNERFLTDPFLSYPKMYKTGDLARWLPDGNIEFLGRIDGQVKIRGFRVELGEIENQLNEFNDIKEVAVVDKEIHEQKCLIAYYVSGQPIKSTLLRNFLIERLPEYMVPAYFVHLDKLPLTVSGKLYRKGLPAPAMDTLTEIVNATNPIEQQLVNLWSEVLKIEPSKISTTISFFELGGHSLRASFLVNKIYKDLNVELPLKAIFKYKDIQSLASYIEHSDKSLFDPITKATSVSNYVLSSAQKRMYFLYEFDKSSTSYNMPQAVRLNGLLDKDKLITTINKLISRHEILRTSFHVENAEPVQHVHSSVKFNLEYKECDTDQINLELQSFIAPFDLNVAPLMRVSLIKIGENDHILLLDKHHIVSDGVSEGIFINDFVKLYNGTSLPKLEFHYKDYAVWQQSTKQLQANKDHRKFWMSVYQEKPMSLVLPTDNPRPLVNDYNGDSINFVLSKAETKALNALAETHESTLFMVLLSVFSILLHKLSQEEDIVIGTPVAGRQHVNLEGIMGMFVNTLAIRTTPKEELTFVAFLTGLKEHVLSCYDHQNYPYEELVEDLDVERNTGRNPLFDVMFSYDSFESSEIEIPGLKISPIEGDHQMSKFDLSLASSHDGDQLNFVLMYATSLFNQATISRFISYFKRIIMAVVADPTIELSAIDILSQVEKNQLLKAFNPAKSKYPNDKTIIDLFDRQASNNSDKIAIVDGNNQISYLELNKRSEQLAQYLFGKGVVRNTVVALMLGRSIDMIIGMLGILKAGGIYLPLAKDQPIARTKYILQTSNALMLVTTGSHCAQYAQLLTTIDISSPLIYGTKPKNNELRKNINSDGVYVIYTSGSTGRPKGVTVSHSALINLIYAQKRVFKIGEHDKILQFSTYTFDASVEQIWIALLSGATLVLIKEEILLDSMNFKRYLSIHSITHLHATPSYLESMNIGYLKGLKRIVSAGENCNVELANRLGRNYCFYNKYGLTEATITSTIYSLPSHGIKGNLVPIGKPISNTNIYILGSKMELLPVGVVGELYVGGAGLSKGYINNEPLSNERFLPNPFMPGKKIYKTGDFGRWCPDGTIEYLGRFDDQVKIRGYRIELGEIVHLLSRYDQITEVEVLVKGHGDNKCLVTYYVSKGSIDPEQLSNYLSECLPNYMVPAQYVRLKQMPLTPHGKIDKKSLLKLETQSGKYTTPTTKTEEQLVLIWSEVLGLEKSEISTSANFFTLGGHSLKAIYLVNQIHRDLSVAVPLKAIFRYQNIRSLGRAIDKSAKTDYKPIGPAKLKDHYILSSAQKRMYFLYEFDKSSTSYNMPQAVRLRGFLDKDKLAITFDKLISRHEILRTSFIVENAEPVQHVHSSVTFNMQYEACNADHINHKFQSFIVPFDLGIAPLMRASLFKVGDMEHILFLDKHHIISDGVSENIFIRDFIALYNESPLPKLELHYKDYAVWQQSAKQLQAKKEHREFWMSVFEKKPSSLVLPTDRPRPLVSDTKGDSINFVLSKKDSKALNSLAEAHESTMFMVLLSIFSILLHKLSHDEDIVVGTPVAGRQHLDLESMVGMFVNTLAIRTKPKGEFTFVSFLAAVKGHVLSCYDHQNYPYEELVEDLEVERNTGRNPLFDVMFSYLNQESSTLEIPGLKITPCESGHQISKFDLSLSAGYEDDQVFLIFEYASALFDKDTIKRFSDYFQRIVASILNKPTITIAAIDILSENEKNRLLYEFNPPNVIYPQHKTVIDLFENQVASYSVAKAIYWNGVELNYKALNTKVNQLANFLIQQKGIKPEDTIGLYVERNPDMLIALMAVMKSGAAYVPLDLAYPAKRINDIIHESKLKLVISNLGNTFKTINHEIDIVDLIKDKRIITKFSIENPRMEIKGHHPCYIIYTSGSSGVPKGVIITHSSLLDYTITFKNYFAVKKNDKVIQQSSLSFDTAVEEIFPTLISGASLVLLSEGGRDIERMVDAINKYSASVISTTPLVVNELNKRAHELESLRVIISGGDVLLPEYISNLIDYYSIYNTYGPSESTVCITYNQINDISRSTNIGKPITNREVYILNNYNSLCPISVSGELCVGGKGLARGYINNNKLTDEKFIENPFKPGEKLYKTGDLARWLTDGSIEYLGRIDNQVKIRGYRIELEEIQNHLLGIEHIAETVVIARNINNENCLIAYYVASEALDHKMVSAHLARKLPNYMIPSHFMLLDELPKTYNGKLDKKNLPNPSLNNVKKFEGPKTIIEKKLVAIWANILNLRNDEIDVNSNFFELGGQSLKATKLVYQIAKEFKVELPLVDIFISPSIRDIALLIDSAKDNNLSENESVVLLNRSLMSNKNMFWIHDGSGDVLGYIEASRLLKNYNSWGVKSPMLGYYAPKNLIIDEIVGEYIKIIKSIQPHGPYQIAGWSIGGALAYEIARKLEDQYEVVDSLIMIDTVLSTSTTHKQDLFSLATEKAILSQLFNERILELDSANSLEALWKSAVVLLKEEMELVEKLIAMIPTHIQSFMPQNDELNIESLVRHINTIRSLLEFEIVNDFNRPIKAQLIYLKASQTTRNVSLLKTHFEEEVLFSTIEGDHFSIMQPPNVGMLVAEIEAAIMRRSQELI